MTENGTSERVGAVMSRLYGGRPISGRTGKIWAPGVSSLSTANNLASLTRLFEVIRPRTSLEIGMAWGGSTLTLASEHSKIGAPHRQHTAIDPFQTSTWDDVGRITLEEGGVQDYVRVIEEYSSIALPSLLSAGEKFQLIYIDGSHLFEDVFIDAYYSIRLLDVGGMVAFDDSSDPHIRKVLDFCFTNYPYLKLVPIEQYRRATLRLRVATALRRNQFTVFENTGEAKRDWNSAFRNF